MKQKVQEELQGLEKEDIICSVKSQADFCARIVAIQKK